MDKLQMTYESYLSHMIFFLTNSGSFAGMQKHQLK